MVNLLLLLAIVIFAAKAAGWVSARLGQPAVLGELLVGLMLGPTLLDLVHLPFFGESHAAEVIEALAEIGVILLMFIAGLEVDLDDMRRSGRVATWAGTLGVAVPWVFGTLLALLFGYPLVKSLFLGVILTATSVSISAQTLIELKVVRSREGLVLLSAAVIDDVLVILVLSIFLALAGGTGAGAPEIALVVGRMLLYLALATAAGLFVIRPLTRWVERLPISAGLLSLAVITTLVFAWSAEALGGIAAITGAFAAGLFFGRAHAREEIEHGVHALTYGFFVPIFFVSIGLAADARAIGWDGLVFTILLCLVAILSKVIGSGLGAWIGGMDRWPALRVGIGMISRGEVGLIVATIGLREGLINDAVYAATVVMVLVTTLATPPLLRLAFRHAGSETVSPQPARKPTDGS